MNPSSAPSQKDSFQELFTTTEGWLPVASGEARLDLLNGSEGGAVGLVLDFDFKGGGGFVVARRETTMTLPESFEFRFHVAGVAPGNKFEFKVADPSGRNVWRWQEEPFHFTAEGRVVSVRNRDLEFAWGPAGGGSPREIGAIEFGIVAGPGGSGRVRLSQPEFIDRTITEPPLLHSSSTAPGFSCETLLTDEAKAGWRPDAGDAAPFVQIDFRGVREFGGAVIEWLAEPVARSFSVEFSADAAEWRVVNQISDARGERTFLYLPTSETRYLRLKFKGAGGIRAIRIEPFDFSRSLVEFFHAVAERSPRGWYPRYLSREQSYWTCAGVAEGEVCALINEEGFVEPLKGSFALEPSLVIDGKLETWAGGRTLARLEEDWLPVPSSFWEREGYALTTTAYATGTGGGTVVWVRYRVANLGSQPLAAKLFVSLRPFQVNPPWQSWQGLGGVSSIRRLAFEEGAVVVNDSLTVVPVGEVEGFGAAAFEQGSLADFLAGGSLPETAAVTDDFGFASGALSFALEIPDKGVRDIYVAIPQATDPEVVRRIKAETPATAALHFEQAVALLRERLGRVEFRLPDGMATECANTFRTAAGHILINRNGSALQPGPRRYTRSWIRDGAIMGAALHRIGEERALTEFIRWYAQFQREDGFVPCVVDGSGVDWLVEHDSHGQLIYGAMEAFRFTRDRSFLEELWPHVRKAAFYIGQLRATRKTAEYQTPEKRDRYGLLPESASHEGYLAHPVHSYWDDFWGVRGLRDAALVAAELGFEDDARRFAKEAADFQTCLADSIKQVIARAELHYVPGSVEWADFDPTATSNAVTLLHGADILPRQQLDAMFDHFVADFRRKHAGEMDWNNYTAYEIRIIGALVHLGKRGEALELLGRFMTDRRPRRWNQWPEISWRDWRSPGHLGDVPHTWIASEYLLVFAHLFAFEREHDQALVLGAGLDPAWLASPEGVSVTGLPTWFGLVDFSARVVPGGYEVRIGGQHTPPPGGYILRLPTMAEGQITINGSSHTVTGLNELHLSALPLLVLNF